MNKGNESRPKENGEDKRDMNAVDGIETAARLAEVCYCSKLGPSLKLTV